MEQEYSLNSLNVIEFSFQVNPNITQAELHVETNTSFAKPIDEDNASGMINASIHIKAKNEQDFKVSQTVILIYDFEEKPVDIEASLREIYEKEGFSVVSDQLDKILESMGKNPFKLKEHIFR